MPSFLGCLATARHLRQFFSRLLFGIGVTFVCVCARGGGINDNLDFKNN